MNIWMIHEVTKEDISYIKTFPKDDILIWDDAVCSQYRAILELKEHKNILAVTPMIAEKALENNYQIIYEPTCKAHERWHKYHDATGFLDWTSIKELANVCEIAAHGLNHSMPSSDIHNSYQFLGELKQIDDMFSSQGITIKSYVYPYNQSYPYTDALIHKIFHWRTYGKERRKYEKRSYYSGR